MFFNPKEKVLRDNAFAEVVHSMIIKGNESVAILKQGRISNPRIDESIKSMVASSQDVYSNHYLKFKEGVSDGTVSLPDFRKKLDALRVLIEEGYYADPTNVTTNQILADWKLYNQPAPAPTEISAPPPLATQQVIVKSTAADRKLDRFKKSIDNSAQQMHEAVEKFSKLVDERVRKQKGK